MPVFAFAPFIAFFIGSTLASIVFRVFATLGIGIITYVGSGLLIDGAANLFLDYASNIPAQYKAVLGYVGFDTAIKMLFSAWTIRFTLTTARASLGVRSS